MDKTYKISFDEETIDSKLTTQYSVLDSTGIEAKFKSKGNIFVSLPNKNIVEESIQVFRLNNNPVFQVISYVVNASRGQIASVDDTSLPEGTEL